MSPPRLYLITDRRATAGRPLADVVAAALRAIPTGLAAVQLRDKDLPASERAALARSLRAVTSAAGAALFVNGDADLAAACGADGVHLPTADLARAAAVRGAQPHLAIAASTHTVAEISAAREGGVDFAVFGPVFDTPEKRPFGPALGTAALAAACLRGLPILALGGVNLHNARSCLAAGAHGLACIRAITTAPDPEATARAFCSFFSEGPSTSPITHAHHA